VLLFAGFGEEDFYQGGVVLLTFRCRDFAADQAKRAVVVLRPGAGRLGLALSGFVELGLGFPIRLMACSERLA
jgi:hypothetical protein